MFLVLKLMFLTLKHMFQALKLMFLAWKHRLIGYKKNFFVVIDKKLFPEVCIVQQIIYKSY